MALRFSISTPAKRLATAARLSGCRAQMRCAVALLRLVSRRNPVLPFVAPALPNPMVARTIRRRACSTRLSLSSYAQLNSSREYGVRAQASISCLAVSGLWMCCLRCFNEPEWLTVGGARSINQEAY